MMVMRDYPLTIEGLADALRYTIEHGLSRLASPVFGGTRQIAKVELCIPRSAWEEAQLPTLESLLQPFADGVVRSYWRTPDGPLRQVALGSTASIVSRGSAVSWSEIKQEWDAYHGALQEVVLIRSAVLPDDDGFHTHQPIVSKADLSELHWYGGVGFPSEKREAPWESWPAALFYLPEFELTEQEDEMRLCAYLSDLHDRETQLSGSVKERLLSLMHPSETVMTSSSHRRLPASINEEDESAWYQDGVTRTAADIREGSYDKLVLARRMLVQSTEPYEADGIVRHLTTHYPGSFTFALCYDGQCFIGASPERLVGVSSHVARVDCLAGTIARGDTKDADEELANDLFQSRKNRLEHQVVLEWIKGALQDYSLDIRHPEVPQMLRLANVQHLHTPLEARLAPDVTILDVVERLHPTPAVAGTPRDAVVPLIRAREKMDRGWYAGCVGLVTGNGDGEMCVSIRSGLIENHSAVLYAGAGIMGDSQASAEWQETSLKLRPMQEALLASQCSASK